MCVSLPTEVEKHIKLKNTTFVESSMYFLVLYFATKNLTNFEKESNL